MGWWVGGGGSADQADQARRSRLLCACAASPRSPPAPAGSTAHAQALPFVTLPVPPCPHAQADKLLSPEFEPIIEQLINFLPRDRQIMLYSATFPVTVKHFKERWLNKVRAGQGVQHVCGGGGPCIALRAT